MESLSAVSANRRSPVPRTRGETVRRTSSASSLSMRSAGVVGGVEEVELGVRDSRGRSAPSPGWRLRGLGRVVGDGEVEVEFAEGVGQSGGRAVGVAGGEDGVDELADASAVLFAGCEQDAECLV